ncbi:DUF4390 domain-containing protein [Ideonella sp.]|uniref:DUF4390 domain-containing protein n=1 Tax=Ideonella sp. TaxID=1929293 RepID=UPI002B4626BF|nr:DUF4390 domain-containing protein [Ideonella sp.]HJV72242.1 DUF4390 domain-containing protein [Ideonella sp.]
MTRTDTAPAPAAHRVIRAVAGALLMLWLALAGPAWAQAIDLPTFELKRTDGALMLDFVARPVLSKAVEDAMQRGVPVYFVAQAALYRSRWYWRDERVARVSRTWRLSYQPLTNSWRLGFGALSQSYPNADEALDMAGRASRWKVADADQLEPGEHYYVEFSYRLDNNQLPRPMQLDLAAQADWQLSVERRIKVEP